MNNALWKPEETRERFLLLRSLHFLLVDATVAGDGCDDKEEVDSENNRITVPKTTCGVLMWKYLSILHSRKCACVCLFYKQSLNEVTKT